jgi:hypothetical protein
MCKVDALLQAGVGGGKGAEAYGRVNGASAIDYALKCTNEGGDLYISMDRKRWHLAILA